MKSLTIMTPRYLIENENGDHFDIFNQRKNAIKAAIQLGTEHPGNTFLVLKKVNNSKKVVFSINLDMQYSLTDIKDIYQSMLEVYGKKSNKVKYWRKNAD